MDHWWNYSNKEKNNFLGKNLPQSLVHHKSNTDWPGNEPRLSRWESDAWAMAWPICTCLDTWRINLCAWLSN